MLHRKDEDKKASQIRHANKQEMVIEKSFSVDKRAEMFETKNMRKVAEKMKGMHHNPVGVIVSNAR